MELNIVKILYFRVCICNLKVFECFRNSVKFICSRPRVEVKLGIRDFILKIMRPLCAHVFFFPIFFQKKTWADFFDAHVPPMFFLFFAHDSAFPNCEVSEVK